MNSFAATRLLFYFCVV